LARSPPRPSGEEERKAKAPGRLSPYQTLRRIHSRVCNAACLKCRGTINVPAVRNHDTSSLAVCNPVAFHRTGPRIALLDMSSMTTSRLPQVNIRMRLIDVCHLYSKNEHPCLGDSWLVSDSVSLAAQQGASRFTPVCPPWRAPGLNRIQGVVFPACVASEQCHRHPCRLSPCPLIAFTREKHMRQGLRPYSPHPRERCMARPAQGAFH
jgi:hypothetical protein